MDADLKAALAFVAGTLILDRPAATWIRDHTREMQIEMSADIRDTYLAFYDYARSCPITGSRHSAGAELFDYGANQGLRFSIDGRRFRGFADGAGAFNGEVEVDAGLVVLFLGEGAVGFHYTLG